MKRLKYTIPILSVIFLLGCRGIGHSQNDSEKPNYSWQQTDSSFALVNNSEVVWQLNFNKKQDKPYFHPLRINGNDLTLDRPADHPWHRGLWFSWKYINKVNYWEENRKKGYSKGRSKIVKVDVIPRKDYSATVNIDLAYAPDGEETLLSEARTLQISRPDADGDYTIDWKLHFTARDSLLVFDRTPPLKHGGTIFGGYAGLSLRAAETLRDPVYTTSTGWMKQQSYTGESGDADWMDLSAVVNEQTNSKGGVTIFDHPDNPRRPTPWYVWFAEGKHTFFTPAILYNAPMTLKPHESITLNYRVYIHSSEPDERSFNKIYNRFKKKI